jgi:hypothetical protein
MYGKWEYLYGVLPPLGVSGWEFRYTGRGLTHPWVPGINPDKRVGENSNTGVHVID